MPTRNHPTPMSPEQLRELLVVVIGGVKQEHVAKWRKIVGEVEKLPLATNVKSNWAVAPTGTLAQRKLVQQCVEIVRAEHPYVAD